MRKFIVFCHGEKDDDAFDSHAPLIRAQSRSLPGSPVGHPESRIRDPLLQRHSGFNLPCPMDPPRVARKVNGQKFKLIHSAEVQLLRLPPTKNVGNKLLAAKLLRKWETVTLTLDENAICAKERSHSLPVSISYTDVLEMSDVRLEGAGAKMLLQIKLRNSDSLLFLQTANSYQRDQWRYSILWAATCHEFNRILSNARRPDALVSEIRKMVTYSMTLPIQDPVVTQFPLEVVSSLIQQNGNFMEKSVHEKILITLAPLLEDNYPSAELCNFFSRHCRDAPRSRIVVDLFEPVVGRILKHNMDFGKSPRMRTFVQDYILALRDEPAQLEAFVASIHGAAQCCPHPRILPNLASICFSAVNKLQEEKQQRRRGNKENRRPREPVFEFLAGVPLSSSANDDDDDDKTDAEKRVSTDDENDDQNDDQNDDENDFGYNNNRNDDDDYDEKIACFCHVIKEAARFDDWRQGLGLLLQPVPFKGSILADEAFVRQIKEAIAVVAADKRCCVHQMVLGIREGKEGWIHIFGPGGIACFDDGKLFGEMLHRLLQCCCRRKKFLHSLSKMLGPCMLLALRENESAIEVLCAMVELEVVENRDTKLQIITTLQSTMKGRLAYEKLTDTITQLKEMQSKGGPRKLTLPSKSTDEDVERLLGSGTSFGSLECLSLAFTQVTSGCAPHLAKLQNLRYLNLWSTDFGDEGLEIISETLKNLQVLNLCETRVTDSSVKFLTSLRNLRKLNLNSTRLTPATYESLKCQLPQLQEFDIRYTDAW